MKDGSHTQGRFNKYLDDNGNELNYAHVVGNGKDENNRSNAHTLDWDGNTWYAGYGEFSYIILRSSTEGSDKKFKLTVDDTGSLSISAI
jgi:hypothetical protein